MNKDLVLRQKISISDVVFEWWHIPGCYYNKVFEVVKNERIQLDVEAESFFEGLTKAVNLVNKKVM